MEEMENGEKNLIPEEGTQGLQEVPGDAVALWIRYDGSDEDIKRLLWSFARGVRNNGDGSVYDREPFDPAQCATVKDAVRLLKDSGMSGVRLFMDEYMREPYELDEEGMAFQFSEIANYQHDKLTGCLYDCELPWFVRRYPHIEFAVGYNITGMEGGRTLVYKSGDLARVDREHYGVYDGKWALNKISFSGPDAEVRRLRDDLQANPDEPGFSYEADTLLLSLYRDGEDEGFFYDYPEVIVEEKTENRVVFYALETYYQEGEYLTHSLFTAKALAEKYRALDFTAAYFCADSAGGEPFVETARFHKGLCVFRQKAEGKAAIDGFLADIPKEVLKKNSFGYELKPIAERLFPDLASLTAEKTAEEWLKTVSQWPLALRFVPPELKTGDRGAELCLAAVNVVIKNELSPLDILAYIPKESRTEELCRAIYDSFDGEEREELSEAWKEEAFCGISDEDDEDVNLEEMDDADKTPERCLAAVKQRWDALSFVPEALKTAELCLAAVKFSGDALECVPEELKTPEICRTAVKDQGRALGFVPDALRTAELCLAAVEAKKYGGAALEFVPEELKTAEMCLTAARTYGYALEYVPEKLKTPEMCLAAVEDKYSALKYVPDALKTTEMCLMAVEQRGGMLEYVPDALKTAEMCRIAINDSKWMVEYVPEFLVAQVAEATGSGSADFLNDRAYFFKKTGRFDKAIADLNKALELKPGGFTEEGYNLYDTRAEMYEAAAEYEKAIADARKALEINPDEETSKEILARCEDALNLSPAALYQRWLDFVREDPSEFRQIPEKYRTREICLIAIESYGSVCEYIPETLQSEEFFIEAVNVNTNGKALKYVPYEFRTLNVCLASVKKFPETVEYVPENLREQVKKAAGLE